MDLNEKTTTRDGWSEIESVYFVQRYNFYKDFVGKGKQFKTRKEMFETIAVEMNASLQSKKTEQQLTTRYYTLTRRNKKAIPAVNMAQGSVVDMNVASVVDIQNIQIMGIENFVVGRNETATSVMQGVASDTNVATEVGNENIQIMDIQNFVVDCNDAEMHDSETDVNGVIVVDTGVTETEPDQTVTENGATSNDFTFVDAIIRGVDRINNQNRFPRFEGPPRSSTPPTVGIATIYSMSKNMTPSIDLTGSENFGSMNVAQTLDIVESSNINLTSSGSSNSNVSSSRATSQSFLKTLPNHESNCVTNVYTGAGSSGSSRNLSVSKKSNVSDSFTDEETKWLLDQYYTYMDEIGPMKLFRTKNVMWKTLASKMNAVYDSTRTADNLSKRVAQVIELKKTVVNRNGLSGGVRSRIKYQEELDKIASLDDSIEPEVMRGIKYVKYKKNIMKDDDVKEQQSSKKPRWDKPNKKAILNSLSATMMAIEERKSARDAAKEERRNESQKVLLELLSSLKKSDN